MFQDRFSCDNGTLIQYTRQKNKKKKNVLGRFLARFNFWCFRVILSVPEYYFFKLQIKNGERNIYQNAVIVIVRKPYTGKDVYIRF